MEIRSTKIFDVIKNHKKSTALITVILCLVAFRLYLPFLVLKYVNRQLNRDPNYRGSVAAVHLTILGGSYELVKLKIEEVKGQKVFPLIAVDQIFIGLSWKDLIHKKIVAQVHFVAPVINVVREPSVEDQTPEKKVVLGGPTQQEKKQEVNTWHEVFKNLVPLDISYFSVNSGSLHYRDITSKPQIDIFLDQLNARGDNLTNSLETSKSLFGHISAHARAMKTGDLDFMLDINPIADPLALKLALELKHLNLIDLNNLFKGYGDIDVKRGRFDLDTQLVIANNDIKGYAKPFIHNLDVADFKQDIRKGLGHAIWEEFVGGVAFLLKNHAKDQQAAVIPFSGRVSDPKVGTWTTIKSVLHNAFIKALGPGFIGGTKLTDANDFRAK